MHICNMSGAAYAALDSFICTVFEEPHVIASKAVVTEYAEHTPLAVDVVQPREGLRHLRVALRPRTLQRQHLHQRRGLLVYWITLSYHLKYTDGIDGLRPTYP